MQVTHVKTSSREVRASANPSLPWSTQDVEHGWFSYYAPGSGVYMNTGNTVAAENKLALLNYFGCVCLCILSYLKGHAPVKSLPFHCTTMLAEIQEQLDVQVMKCACECPAICRSLLSA